MKSLPDPPFRPGVAPSSLNPAFGLRLGCCTPGCWAHCGQFMHFWVSLNQPWLWPPSFRVCFHFRLPIAKSLFYLKSHIFGFGSEVNICMCICRWSCEITFCATSYSERGFYQMDMLFKDFSLCNSSQNEKLGAVKGKAVVDWSWTWDAPFGLLALPLFPVIQWWGERCASWLKYFDI